MRHGMSVDVEDWSRVGAFERVIDRTDWDKADRTSMAVGLRAREPLLDHRLVKFATTLPPSLRLREGEEKWLMKQALCPYLPPGILRRPKQGFVTPASAWFRDALMDAAAALARSRTLGYGAGSTCRSLPGWRRATAAVGRSMAASCGSS